MNLCTKAFATCLATLPLLTLGCGSGLDDSQAGNTGGPGTLEGVSEVPSYDFPAPSEDSSPEPAPEGPAGSPAAPARPESDESGAPEEGVEAGGDPVPDEDPLAEEAPPPPPVDCGPLADRGFDVCLATRDTCEAVFDDGAGCEAVCGAAQLVCLASHENIDGRCAPDLDRPALPCAGVGHQSDHCLCGRPGDPADPADPPDPAERAEPAEPVDPADQPGAVEILCNAQVCPAFPGAEGFGADARGGRGGDVCFVRSLSDDGGGTLRRCLTQGRGTRTVVFEVSGVIDLRSPLVADRNRLTIAGQTAPGAGVTVRGYQVDLRGDDLILQHVRFRAGDVRKMTRSRDGFTEDSLTLSGRDIMVDHVSASWGIDESLSGGASFGRMTVQYSIVSEGLHRTRLFHGEYDADHDGHSMGSLFKPRDGDGSISVHHNLYAHNNNRNPAVGGYDRDQRMVADIRNNVIYNCRNMGYVSGESGDVRVNYVGNYAVFGADSRTDRLFKGNRDSDVRIWADDNWLDRLRNARFDGRDVGWAAIGDDADRAGGAFDTPPVTTHLAPDALELVLDEAGARPWDRDSVDLRVTADVRNNTGARIDSQDDVGGWDGRRDGDPAPDGDRDGMPDSWERDHGADPERADNNGDADGDGYTNLENYLHWAGRVGPAR